MAAIPAAPARGIAVAIGAALALPPEPLAEVEAEAAAELAAAEMLLRADLRAPLAEELQNG